IRLSPARDDYRLMLVDVFIAQRDFARATDILGRMVAQGTTKDVRERARTKLGDLAAIRASNGRAQSDAALSAPPPASPMATSRASSTPPPSIPRVIPALRRPATGETRALGMFQAVECVGGGVTLVLETPAGRLRLTAPSFQQIEFISYRDDAPKSIPCGAIDPVQHVLATYRGLGSHAAGEAEAVAIELLPDDYQPNANP